MIKQGAPGAIMGGDFVPAFLLYQRGAIGARITGADDRRRLLAGLSGILCRRGLANWIARKGLDRDSRRADFYRCRFYEKTRAIFTRKGGDQVGAAGNK